MASAVATSFSQLKRVDTLPGVLRAGANREHGTTPFRVASSQGASILRRASRRATPRASVVEADSVSSTPPLYIPRLQYAESIYKTVRRPTRTVMVGDVAVGSDFPIRVQTMTTSDTKNVQATVDEVMRIADRGAEICRITVQGKKEAEACEQIKSKLVQLGYNIPLVADIHFAPTIALRVADCFEKIRVNPGNFADNRAVFKTVEYTDESYQRELEHIEEVFSKLVIKCKQLGRAMRIGTNHGSLSDRIMSYYGDSPRGMVESALEFARICRKYDYHNFVFSMKASNPVVMVSAYRLLAAALAQQGPDWNYPLHLGVTEAGEGEDGRMKSAIGIGALLQDGLGDTIRVSLTEAPELEIEPCSKLAAYGMRAAQMQRGVEPFEEKHRSYYEFSRRTGQLPLQRECDDIDFRSILHRDGSVLLSVPREDLQHPEKLYRALACKLIVGMPFKDLATADTLLLRELPGPQDKEARLALKRLQEVGVGVMAPLSQLQESPLPNAIALLSLQEVLQGAHKTLAPSTRVAVSVRGDEPLEQLQALKDLDAVMLLAHVPYEEETVGRVQASRRLFEFLASNNITAPVIHHIRFPQGIAKDDLVLQSGSEAGALLVDGLGDGVFLEAPGQDLDFLRTTSFGMLQGCRMRNTKTEFVSCPSCGRTLFDLQEVTASIRERTSHLPGVAIAIMGCIVNGPGEMADADFGYVGGAPGKIDLYVGKEVVQRAIPMEEATDALIALIKEHGRWVEPEKEEEAVLA